MVYQTTCLTCNYLDDDMETCISTEEKCIGDKCDCYNDSSCGTEVPIKCDILENQ